MKLKKPKFHYLTGQEISLLALGVNMITKVTVLPNELNHKCLVDGYKREVRCNRKSKYMVYDNSGETKWSTLLSSPCEQHLTLAIKRGLARVKK